jgi:hypothetical protein
MERIMLKVICWKWVQPNYRSKFNQKHVHILKSMLERNLDMEYDFLCITDNPNGLNCKTMPLWDYPKIYLPEKRPNCYRRLRVFEKNAADWLNTDTILSIDLDVVIVDNITEIVSNMIQHDFSAWGDTAVNTHYNGSFWTLKLGTRSSVWDEFDPVQSPKIVNRNSIVGSDQGWLSYHLGGDENKITHADGILSYRLHVNGKELPDTAKMVFFHGNYDPQSKETLSEAPWIKDYYFE